MIPCIVCECVKPVVNVALRSQRMMASCVSAPLCEFWNVPCSVSYICYFPSWPSGTRVILVEPYVEMQLCCAVLEPWGSGFFNMLSDVFCTFTCWYCRCVWLHFLTCWLIFQIGLRRFGIAPLLSEVNSQQMDSKHKVKIKAAKAGLS